MQAGFNIFEGVNAQQRAVGGYGDEFSVELSEKPEKVDDGADIGISFQFLGAMTASLLLAF